MPDYTLRGVVTVAGWSGDRAGKREKMCKENGQEVNWWECSHVGGCDTNEAGEEAARPRV